MTLMWLLIINFGYKSGATSQMVHESQCRAALTIYHYGYAHCISESGEIFTPQKPEEAKPWEDLSGVVARRLAKEKEQGIK